MTVIEKARDFEPKPYVSNTANMVKLIEDFTDVREMTNAQLRQIVDRIEVGHDGKVDIYLKIFGHLNLDDHTILIGHIGT